MTVRSVSVAPLDHPVYVSDILESGKICVCSCWAAPATRRGLETFGRSVSGDGASQAEVLDRGRNHRASHARPFRGASVHALRSRAPTALEHARLGLGAAEKVGEFYSPQMLLAWLSGRWVLKEGED